MNELAMTDKNLSMERTPQLIAVEINSIKEQTRKMVLFNSIEIGRRLTEAKLLINHGEWGEWLCNSVDYSQRTASNLMRIFDEYGSSQITLFCDNAKSQTLANLSYTQAVALLGIPQGEREAFIQEHDIDNMSTRELQQEIKKNQELEEKVKVLEAGWALEKTVMEDEKRKAEEKAEEAHKLLEATKKESREEIERLESSISETKKLLAEAESSGLDNEEVEQLEKSLDETQIELASSLSKIANLEKQLKEIPLQTSESPVVEKVPEEVEKELKMLRERMKEFESKAPAEQPENTAKIRFSVHLDSLVAGFKNLLGVLAELKELDIEVHERYKNATANLIAKMSERL